jgi:polar amino acid transport system substrate-binding protein
MAAALAGCDYPRDADGTLERVRGGVLRVGLTERAPFVGPDGGIEPALIAAFARELDAKVQWLPAAESDLAHALDKRHIDVAIGGFTRDLAWKSRGAPTRPYLQARLLVAARPGAEMPANKDALAGRTVQHRPHRPDVAALIAAAGGEPTTQSAPLVAAYDFELAQLGLEASPVELARERLVFMAPPGENRFLLALDRFLVRWRP